MKFVFGLLGIAFAALSVFFAYYTLRLLYINLTALNAAQHRQAGMYIGAVVFPIAAVVFGWLSRRCFKNL